MTHLARNDSSSVISSLQMDYSDSDDDENTHSRNNSRDDREEFDISEVKLEKDLGLEENDSGDMKMDIDQLPDEPTSSGIELGSQLVKEEKDQQVKVEEGSDKEAEGTPTDNISDDEDHHADRHRHSHHHHHHDKTKAKILAEALQEDSPSSQSSVPPVKKAMRLVSYGPDEDLDDEESESEEEHEQSVENSPEQTDTSALSRSVLNMASDDIKIPPEPPGHCSYQLQKKIEVIYNKMRTQGLDLNREIQDKKNFRNPSIYEKLIEFCNIDEKGTNFPHEIYDPHIWGKESFYDELDRAQRKDMEKREKEKREKTKIDFVIGTKKASSASTSDSSSYLDDKKRKTKWDAQPPLGVTVGVIKAPGVHGPGVVNLTATATGTKATVISALGSLSKKAGK